MDVIGREILRDAIRRHPQARAGLGAWLRVAEEASWRHLVDVRQSFPHADFADGETIFNIEGNKYRLSAIVGYRTGIVSVLHLETYAEYTKRMN